MPQSLDSYITTEWLDYPTSKIDSDDGEEFAKWLIKNDGDEYFLIVADESIVEIQNQLQIFKILGDAIKIENAEMDLKQLIDIVFKESLVSAIEAYRNSYDEQEEMQLESISFDNQRMM